MDGLPHPAFRERDRQECSLEPRHSLGHTSPPMCGFCVTAGPLLMFPLTCAICKHPCLAYSYFISGCGLCIREIPTSGSEDFCGDQRMCVGLSRLLFEGPSLRPALYRMPGPGKRTLPVNPHTFLKLNFSVR